MDRKSQGNLIRFKNMLAPYMAFMCIECTDDYLLINYKSLDNSKMRMPRTILINFAFMKCDRRYVNSYKTELTIFKSEMERCIPHMDILFTLDTGSIKMSFMDGNKRKQIIFSSPLTTEIINFLKLTTEDAKQQCRPTLVMRDGFAMYIRANEKANCDPCRILTHGRYRTVEVILFSGMEEGLLVEYETTDEKRYAQVPLEVVGRIIFKHGGIDYMETFEEGYDNEY